jgi:hypothetical protein
MPQGNATASAQAVGHISDQVVAYDADEDAS